MLLAGLAVLAGFSGCSGSIADYLLEEQIRCLNDVAAAMENGAPDFKIYELKARAQEAGRKLGALNLTEAEKKSLGERHRGELERVRQRWGAAMLRYAARVSYRSRRRTAPRCCVIRAMRGSAVPWRQSASACCRRRRST